MTGVNPAGPFGKPDQAAGVGRYRPAGRPTAWVLIISRLPRIIRAVLATAIAAWMLGSVIGYAIGFHGGRKPLDHPGRFEKSRRKLLAKGDRVFVRYNFVASVTLPAFVSGSSG
jgi:hypothetical protein